MNPQVEINIDELVLHGFSPAEKLKIGRAIEQALIQAITDNGTAAFLQGGDMPFADGGSFQVQPGAKPAQVGNHIAQSVYSALTGL